MYARVCSMGVIVFYKRPRNHIQMSGPDYEESEINEITKLTIDARGTGVVVRARAVRPGVMGRDEGRERGGGDFPCSSRDRFRARQVRVRVRYAARVRRVAIHEVVRGSVTRSYASRHRLSLNVTSRRATALSIRSVAGRPFDDEMRVKPRVSVNNSRGGDKRQTSERQQQNGKTDKKKRCKILCYVHSRLLIRLIGVEENFAESDIRKEQKYVPSSTENAAARRTRRCRTTENHGTSRIGRSPVG